MTTQAELDKYLEAPHPGPGNQPAIALSDYLAQAEAHPTGRQVGGGKSLRGIMLENNLELLSNIFKVMGVDTGGRDSHDYVKLWNLDNHDIVEQQHKDAMNRRNRKQRATMLRRQVLLKMRLDGGGRNVSLRDFATEYYNRCLEYGYLDLARP